MLYIIFKYFLTSTAIVIISEVAKRNDKLGAIIASLPIITFLTLIWLYVEKQPMSKIANHAYYTFWYVLPTLPMFLMFPYLLNKFGFWLTLLISVILTAGVFIIYANVLKKWGIDLL